MDILGGEASSAGIVVTPQKLISNVFLWRGLNIIANQTSALDLITYRNLKQGKEKYKQHPVYYALKNQVSDFVSSQRFLQVMVFQCALFGSSYAEIIWKNGNLYLNHLDSEETTAFKENGRLAYLHNLPSGGSKILLPENVLHFRSNLGNNCEIGGFSLANVLKESLSNGLQLTRFSNTFWKNNAQGNVYFEFDVPFADNEARKRFRTSYLQAHQGMSNQNLPVIAEGFKAKKLSADMEANQFLQSREFDKDVCAAALSIGSSFLESKNRVSYSSLVQDKLNLLSDLNATWLVMIENECKLKLLTEAEKRSDSITIEFKREGLLQHDPQTTSQILQQEYQAGMISFEEMRAIKNLPVESEGTFLIKAEPVEAEPAPEPAPPTKEADQLQQMTRSTIKRMFNVIQRSTKPLQDHKELFMSSLQVYDPEKVKEFYATLEDEIEAALPEQKKTILQNKNIDQIIEVIK